MAILYGTKDNSIATEFNETNAKSGLTWHESIPNIPICFAASVSECFRSATDNLPGYRGSDLDSENLANRIIEELRHHPNITRQDLSNAAHIIVETLHKSNSRAAKRLLRFATTVAIEPDSLKLPSGFWHGKLTLDCSEFGIQEIFAATVFVAKIIAPKWTPFFWPIRGGCLTPASIVANVKSSLRDVMPPVLWRLVRRLYMRH
jgi:hypothetical protein